MHCLFVRNLDVCVYLGLIQKHALSDLRVEAGRKRPTYGQTNAGTPISWSGSNQFRLRLNAALTHPHPLRLPPSAWRCRESTL